MYSSDQADGDGGWFVLFGQFDKGKEGGREGIIIEVQVSLCQNSLVSVVIWF